MNYLLVFVKFIDQIMVNHGEHQVQCDKFLKSCVPKVVPQPWMPPVSPILIVLLTTNCKPQFSVTKMLTQHYLSLLVKKIGVMQLLPLTKWFFIQISIIHDNVSSQVPDNRRSGFWSMDELIHQQRQFLLTCSQAVSSKKVNILN